MGGTVWPHMPGTVWPALMVHSRAAIDNPYPTSEIANIRGGGWHRIRLATSRWARSSHNDKAVKTVRHRDSDTPDDLDGPAVGRWTTPRERQR